MPICSSLCQVALNTVISNAIKYTPEKSTVQINCYDDGEKYVCELTDQGKGFDEQTRETALKPFGDSTNHMDMIIGIDIAATNMIMKAHGGYIDIQNNKPNGAKVSLFFSKK